MVEQSIQQPTNNTYASAYNQYLKFCNQFGLPLWPTNQTHMELQLLYWHAFRLEQVKANTLRSQYYGLKYMAATAGHPIQDEQMYMLKRQRRALTTAFGAGAKDPRKPITIQMLTQAYKHFNIYNYNELVYYTMMVAATTALMRTAEIFSQTKTPNANSQQRQSVQALFIRNLKMKKAPDGRPLYYICTCRATKTDKAKVDVEVIWGKGPWPTSPVDLITAMLMARYILAPTNPKLAITPHSPLFMLQNGTIVTRKDMKTRFEQLLRGRCYMTSSWSG